MAAFQSSVKSVGYSDKQVVRILTIDKDRSRVECATRDGASVFAAIWETPTVFRWPNVGEIWAIRKDSGIWRLDQIVQTPRTERESDATPATLQELGEGDSRIMGNKVHVQQIIEVDPLPHTHDALFTYEQKEPSETWAIKHDLEKYSSVSTVNTEGRQIYGSVEMTSDSEIVVEFFPAVAGKAYLN